MTLKVNPCYQFDLFTPEQRQRFFNARYILTPQMDRMRYGLSGEVIECQGVT
ncbi:biotin-dependent carboxyltransferase family protein [Vibrio tetraodonis]|uniref:biotin-dependent carboxyltransferase family protein n=1 Tax=Vibrio tetraodonis TaxID=2231647 RepID=UPI00136F91A6|nr:biotin-dependent carboxyltransferase family protein [Vibrio tetraodonis]